MQPPAFLFTSVCSHTSSDISNHVSRALLSLSGDLSAEYMHTMRQDEMRKLRTVRLLHTNTNRHRMRSVDWSPLKMCKQELGDKVVCNLAVPDAKFIQTEKHPLLRYTLLSLMKTKPLRRTQTPRGKQTQGDRRKPLCTWTTLPQRETERTLKVHTNAHLAYFQAPGYGPEVILPDQILDQFQCHQIYSLWNFVLLFQAKKREAERWQTGKGQTQASIPGHLSS